MRFHVEKQHGHAMYMNHAWNSYGPCMEAYGFSTPVIIVVIQHLCPHSARFLEFSFGLCPNFVRLFEYASVHSNQSGLFGRFKEIF